MTVFALIGAMALWLTFAWLLSAIVCSYLSDRKGYGERPGLASGLLLNVARHRHLAGRAGQGGLALEAARPVGPRRSRKNPPPARSEDTGGAEPPPAAAS